MQLLVHNDNEDVNDNNDDDDEDDDDDGSSRHADNQVRYKCSFTV